MHVLQSTLDWRMKILLGSPVALRTSRCSMLHEKLFGGKMPSDYRMSCCLVVVVVVNVLGMRSVWLCP